MKTIDLAKEHRCVRKYLDKEIPEALKRNLLEAAQMAASSSHFQAYSLIEINSKELREMFYEVSGGQEWVRKAPWVLLVCADLYRSKHFYMDVNPEHLGYSEAGLVAVTDAALVAQNITLTAESEGLGVAFVGGIRNDTNRIIKELGLPELVFPLYLLCIGYPDEKNDLKPRLPLSVIVHEDGYQTENYEKDIEDYNKEMGEYYEKRGAKRYKDWSINSGLSLKAKPRQEVGPSMKEQGFFKE